jgi:hypothetical protein
VAKFCGCTDFPMPDPLLTDLTHVESVISLVPNPGRPAPPWVSWAHAFLPHHLLVSYYLRLPLVLDIMKICMDFGPYDALSSSDA